MRLIIITFVFIGISHQQNIETTNKPPNGYLQPVTLKHQQQEIFFNPQNYLPINQPYQQFQTFASSGQLNSFPSYNNKIISNNKNNNQYGYTMLSPVIQHNGFYNYPSGNQYNPSGDSNKPFALFQNPTAFSQFYSTPLNNQYLTFNSPQTNQPIPQYTNAAVKVQKPANQPIAPPPAVAPLTPLYQHQIYHPLHTTTINSQPKLIQKPNVRPPKQPITYHKTLPALPKNIKPVYEPEIPVEEPQKHVENKETEEDEDYEEKGEINEEESEEDENEKIQESDEESNNEKNSHYDNEDNFKSGRFDFSDKFREDDDDNHDRYRSHYSHDDDNTGYHSNTYFKKQPQQSPYNNYDSFFNNKFHNDFIPFSHETKQNSKYTKPKVQLKMYKYTMSSKNPQEKETIQGKESELKPVIQHKQESFQSKWMISSEITSNNDN